MGWSVHNREPYLHFHRFFPTPLFQHIELFAVKLTLCNRCSMFSVVSPALILSILSGSIFLLRCRCLGVTVSWFHFYLSPPIQVCVAVLYFPIAWSLCRRVFYFLFPAPVIRPLCEHSSAPFLPQLPCPSVCHGSLNPP